MVPAQAAGEPDRQTATAHARAVALQPAYRARLAVQGGVPAALGLRLTCVGRQIPRPVVHPGDAFTHRTDEEIRPHRAGPPGTDPQLLPRAKAVLQRHRRGLEQQSQSHHAKSLWLSNLQSDGNRALSCTWKPPRAANHPHFLLTKRNFINACKDHFNDVLDSVSRVDTARLKR